MTRSPTRLQRPHPLPSRQLLAAPLATGPLYSLRFRLRPGQSHGLDHLFQDAENPSRLAVILSLVLQDRVLPRTSHLCSRLPHPAIQPKAAHMRAQQHLNSQSRGEIQTQMPTGGDVRGIQELGGILGLAQRPVGLVITRRQTRIGPRLLQFRPLLKLPVFRELKASTMHPLRFLDASQVQCK